MRNNVYKKITYKVFKGLGAEIYMGNFNYSMLKSDIKTIFMFEKSTPIVLNQLFKPLIQLVGHLCIDIQIDSAMAHSDTINF